MGLDPRNQATPRISCLGSGYAAHDRALAAAGLEFLEFLDQVLGMLLNQLGIGWNGQVAAQVIHRRVSGHAVDIGFVLCTDAGTVNSSSRSQASCRQSRARCPATAAHWQKTARTGSAVPSTCPRRACPWPASRPSQQRLVAQGKHGWPTPAVRTATTAPQGTWWSGSGTSVCAWTGGVQR